MIEPIYADSSNKNEVYRLLNAMHVMAGQMACAKVGGWGIKSTCTLPPEYVMTTWTNGVVDLIAETRNGEHEYSMVAVVVEEE